SNTVAPSWRVADGSVVGGRAARAALTAGRGALQEAVLRRRQIAAGGGARTRAARCAVALVRVARPERTAEQRGGRGGTHRRRGDGRRAALQRRRHRCTPAAPSSSWPSALQKDTSDGGG